MSGTGIFLLIITDIFLMLRLTTYSIDYHHDLLSLFLECRIPHHQVHRQESPGRHLYKSKPIPKATMAQTILRGDSDVNEDII